MAATGGPGPKVTIGSVLDRSKGGKAYPSPWSVKWRVGLSSRSRVFKDKSAATVFHARLISARAEGMRFDVVTGLPELWAFSDELLCDFVKKWFEDQRGSWSPRSRRNASDGLVPFLIEMVRPKATKPKPGTAEMAALRASVRDWLAGPKNIEAPLYLRRWSLPLSDIDEDVCKQVAQAVYRKQDGTPVAASSQHRIRTNIRAMFKAAVEAKKMTGQPWPGATSRKTERITKQVNVRALPNRGEAVALIEGQTSADYKALSYMCFYGGLRPSEAAAVTVELCTLPDTGWGSIRIDRAVQDAGRWTETGEEIGDPKTVARTVPIPPVLVEILRTYIGERTSGLVVATRNGKTVQASNWGKQWRASRAALGVTWVPYDLRHACATTWLGAGVPIGECARRLGHSPEVLLSTYAGVLTGDEAIANQRIEEALS